MARFAKIKELDLAMLGTQTASIFTLRFAENAESNVPKWIRSEAQTLHTVFVTERYFENYSNQCEREECCCERVNMRLLGYLATCLRSLNPQSQI